jgi:hypothetical protein
MNKLFINVPAFVQTDTYPTYEFETIEDLVQSGNIDAYLKNDNHLELSGNLLMSVSEDQKYWWVIGRVASTEGISLPTWKAL